MKLSEAIRLGAMLRPNQAFGSQFVVEDDATCALGAAAEAVGILDLTVRNGYTGNAPQEWVPVVLQRVSCAAGCARWFVRVDDCIKHLNNEHRWTRERIADWIATIEAKLVETPQPEPLAAAHGGKEP